MKAGQRLAQEAGRVEQRAQTGGVRAPRQLLEPQLGDDAVLATQRHDIGHRAKRGHLDEPRQPTCVVGPLAQRLHQLERDADAGEVLVRIGTVGTLRIDDRERRRQRGVRFVMVRYHEIKPELACSDGGRRGSDTTVDRDHHRDLLRREPLDGGRFEPIPILDPVRDEVNDVGPE